MLSRLYLFLMASTAFLELLLPVYGICVLAFLQLIPFAQTYYFPKFEPYHFNLVLSIILVFGPLVKGWDLRHIKYIFYVFLFVVVIAISAVFSGIYYPSTYYEYSKRILFSVVLVCFIRDYKSVALLLKSCVLGCICNAAFAIYEQFHHLPGREPEGWVVGYIYRSSGFQDDANYLAMVLVAATPLAYYFYVHSKNKFSRLYYILCLPLFAGGIFSSVSRGGLLGFVLVLGCLFLKNIKKFSMFVVVGIIAVGFIYVAKNMFLHRETIKSSLSGRASLDSSAGLRLKYYVQALELWKYHPVFGVGLNNFNKACKLDLGITKAGKQVHNLFLTYLCELGIVGFLLYMKILLINFNVLKKIRRQDSVYGELAWCLQISIVGFLICSLFSSSGGLTMVWILLSVPLCLENTVFKEHGL